MSAVRVWVPPVLAGADLKAADVLMASARIGNAALEDDTVICALCGAVGPWALGTPFGDICYHCAGFTEAPEPEDPCECCGATEPDQCDCRIEPCQVELLSDERGSVYGTGRGCATHKTEL